MGSWCALPVVGRARMVRLREDCSNSRRCRVRRRSGGSAVSVRCTAWAWSVADTIPSSPSLLVLLKLADMAWDNGKVWPSHAYLAKGTKLSTRTVRSAVEALEREGFLRTDPRPGRTDVIWLAVTNRIDFDGVP